MKSAKEMGMVTTKVIADKIEKSRQKALEILENRIAPDIERTAMDGEYTTTFYVDTGIDIQVIVSELQSNGYEVTKSGRSLRISWFNFQ